MKKLLTALFTLTVLTMNAQGDFPGPPEVMLIGKHPFSALIGNTEEYAWFDKAAGKVQLDSTTIEAIKTIKPAYKIVMVGGTWCSDTQELLPKFYKLVEKANIKDVELYFTDRDKKMPEDIVKKYAVSNIPVFIVFDKNGLEVGRITESVKVSIEADLLAILKTVK